MPKKSPKRIGLTIIGGGRVGLIRGEVAARQWLNRLAVDVATQHATAAEPHNRLMLTKAFDISARLKRAVALPIAAVSEKPRAGVRAAG